MIHFSELRYRHYFQHQVYQSYVLFTQLSLFAYASFAVFDVLAIGDLAMHAVIVRLLFVVFASFLVHYFTKTQNKYLELLEAIAFTFAGWIIIWISFIALQGGNNDYQNGVVGVILYLGTISRMRFLFVSVATITILIPYFIFLSPDLFSIDAGKEREQVTLILTAIMLCGFAAYRRELEIRSRYQQQRKVRRQKLALAAYSKQLKYLSETDSLSGLKNRHYLHSVAIPGLHSTTQLAVMLIDIDHFKSINDEFGHNIGDAVIRHVAMMIERGLPEEAITVRYGGEEFLVLIPKVTCSKALDYANHIHAQFQNEHFPYVEHCTVSIGVWHGDTFDSDLRGPINQADMAMYKAKQAGRNRIEIA